MERAKGPGSTEGVRAPQLTRISARKDNVCGKWSFDPYHCFLAPIIAFLTPIIAFGTVRTVVWEDGGGDPASYPIERVESRRDAK